MLTEEATYERTWGWIPILGKLLGKKRIPDHYFGFSSVSDNEFEYIRRLMTIAILINENLEEIKIQMTSSYEFEKELHDELCRVAQALEGVARRFHDQSLQITRYVR